MAVPTRGKARGRAPKPREEDFKVWHWDRIKCGDAGASKGRSWVETETALERSGMA